MKHIKIILIIGILILAQLSSAVDIYVFQADEANDSFVSSCTVRTTPNGLSWEGWVKDPLTGIRAWKKYYTFTVTQAEYSAGWAALAQATKDAGKAVAQAERSDFGEQFDKLLKAFALVVLDEINILRANAGMAERTVAQLKTAVTNKYDSLP